MGHKRRAVIFVENTPEQSNMPTPPEKPLPKGGAAIAPPPTEAAATIAKLQGHVNTEGKGGIQVFTPLEYMKSWDQDFMAPAKAHEKFNHYNPEVPESEFRVIAPATIRQPGVYPGAVVQSDDTDEVPAAYTVYMPPVIKKAYIPGRDPEPGTEQDAPPSDTPMQPMAPSMASPMVPPILNPPMEHPKGAPPVTPRDSAAVLPAAMTMQQYPGMQGAMPSYPGIGVQYPAQTAGYVPSTVQYTSASVQQYPAAPMPSPYAPMSSAYPGMMPAPAIRGYPQMVRV
jgi:hypothetical protein